MITLTLPWPAKELSPNARVHWAKKSKAVKVARQGAEFLCVSALMAGGNDLRGRKGLKVHYVFHPCDKRRRDLDNLIASTKAWNDGLADALSVDDSTFSMGYLIGHPRKPACVVVEIS